jgi:hypothetical protein
MATLGDVAKLVRSKNAGPFWLTIDIMFDDVEAYRRAGDADIVNRAAIARRPTWIAGHASACAVVGAGKAALEPLGDSGMEQMGRVHASGLAGCNRILMARPTLG